ncbi:hypothetical protein BDD43_0748 [Mucilaginibacter gracilis]|uniref:Uncharacterized protein n=2 Tax=Mucilaginibacter gracilis TaxID=423350 RepID=A0A495IVV7_9SPHI|nr:hypothetical protein BDD43_0748 [Mucilaginibacter gracilis]
MMEQLNNKGVIVHPLLTHDPQRMQGQIGIISNIVHENDEVYVEFPYNKTGIYSRDAVLTLLPKEMLLAHIHDKLEELEPKDARILLDIYRLQRNGQPAAIEEALRWAIGYDTIGRDALVTVKDYIDRGLSEDIAQHHSIGR